jgi:hypothetical protein
MVLLVAGIFGWNYADDPRVVSRVVPGVARSTTEAAGDFSLKQSSTQAGYVFRVIDGSITVVGSVDGYDISYEFGQIKADTGTLRTDINAIAQSTGTLGDLTQIKLDTGTLRTDLNAIKLDTGTLRTDLNAVKLDTGTLRTDLDAVALSTGTIHDNLGNHIATTTLNMNNFGLVNVSSLSINTYSAEKVSNGSFATSDNWVVGSFIIAGGSASLNGGNSSISQDCGLQTGILYTAQINIVSIDSGYAKIAFGNTVLDIPQSPGLYTFNSYATGNNNISVIVHTGLAHICFDYISVTEQLAGNIIFFDGTTIDSTGTIATDKLSLSSAAVTYLQKNEKASDSNLLDGNDSLYFSSVAYVQGIDNIVAQIRIDTASISGADLTQIRLDTGTLRTDLSTLAASTAPVAQIAQIKLDTGTLQDQLDQVAIDTGAIVASGIDTDCRISTGAVTDIEFNLTMGADAYLANSGIIPIPGAYWTATDSVTIIDVYAYANQTSTESSAWNVGVAHDNMSNAGYSDMITTTTAETGLWISSGTKNSPVTTPNITTLYPGQTIWLFCVKCPSAVGVVLPGNCGIKGRGKRTPR